MGKSKNKYLKYAKQTLLKRGPQSPFFDQSRLQNKKCYQDNGVTLSNYGEANTPRRHDSLNYVCTDQQSLTRHRPKQDRALRASRFTIRGENVNVISITDFKKEGKKISKNTEPLNNTNRAQQGQHTMVNCSHVSVTIHWKRNFF